MSAWGLLTGQHNESRARVVHEPLAVTNPSADRKIQRHKSETGCPANGIREPVLLGPDGRVWDGHRRLMAARLLGIRQLTVEHGEK